MSNKKDVAVKISGGKKIREAREKVKSDTLYNLTNAVERLKSASYVKFDPTLEIVMKLAIDSRHSDQMVRGVVNLPAGTGKTVRVAVICKEEREEEAKSAGADLVGSTNIIDEIKAGKINFDVCIATPDMMVAIGSVARILGPKGLMPNPKLGTVTLDIKNAIKNAKSGQVEYRAEKAGIIHAGLGKLSFSDQDLLKNLNAFIEAVIKAKPAGLKGSYLKAMYLSSTMGVSVQIDLTSIA
ncbi:ribosomal protein L1 [Rickettsia parkeri str. Tate's Hell]|uniref:Large ribosomal subunit protein uL1 n=1 Tax=Rickettsia parkeri str. Tate's Hell TaxID=1359189 RepID=A0ABR5DS54_RICPA|nr:50S ribosomal protein L1 [Rickettsia parkeri]AFC74374.1 50S ribosomal protein L1 [Rickettsia parkeri str. Portsmouth]KJV93926.1 ribosomal protein L1 [Rickettsia parkeri str. Grand Bay]KJV95569.1 ribosomal protein L1 [Rickettsia parkeri str. AT\